MSLRFKIAENLPHDSTAVRALLSIASIEETDTIASACVTLGQNPRLLINPEFVNQHADTPIKLQTLIGHELLHVALGHTRRYATCSALDNLVFDCLINAMLAKADPTPERTALFRDFYAENKFPECFLRPPDVWHPSVRVRLPKALKHPHLAGAPFIQDVYRRLWGDAGASGSEIRSAILLGLAAQDQPPALVIDDTALLGGHEGGHGGGHGGSEDAPPSDVMAQRVTDLLYDELNQKMMARGVPPHDLLPLQHSVTKVQPSSAKVKRQLCRLVTLLAHSSGSGKLRCKDAGQLTHLTPIPHKDRRATVQRLMGGQPMLYGSPSTTTALRATERIHVYLDVSYSMDEVVAALYGAMRTCEQWMHREVHLFSTTVSDLSFKQLKQGVIVSGGGTNINCVAQHVQAHRVKRALLLTDGYVGELSDKAKDVFRGMALVVGLAGISSTPQHLAGIARKCETLATDMS